MDGVLDTMGLDRLAEAGGLKKGRKERRKIQLEHLYLGEGGEKSMSEEKATFQARERSCPS